MKIEKITNIKRNLPESKGEDIAFKQVKSPDKLHQSQPLRPVLQNDKIGNKLNIMA